MSSAPPVTDAEVRARALDPAHSFIVQAPAGSGKTGLLVYRMLTLLARVEHPESVLAITFTRKATREMRERLLGLLRRAAHGEMDQDAFIQQGLDLATAVLEQDRRQGWGLLDMPRRINILTIDALATKLVNAMPWLSRLGAQASASDQANDLYEAAIDQCLQDQLNQATPHPRVHRVLMAFDFNYRVIKSNFAALLARRDQWLRHVVGTSVDAHQATLSAAWDHLHHDLIEAVRDTINVETQMHLLALAETAWRNLVEQDRRPLGFESFDALEDEQQQWRLIAFICLTQKGQPRSKLTVREGFPPSAKADKEALLTLLSDLASNKAFFDALLELMHFPERALTPDEWERLSDIDYTLKLLASYLQLQFRARAKTDHAEVAQRANQALGALEGPTDLLLKWDYQLQHILLDEFQDTAFSQIELLKQLTQGWSEAVDQGARTLFLVGDPMQSIYRFREAEVGLFLDVWNNATTQVFEHLHIEPLRLSHNFRSSQHLVEWFNQTFAVAFPSRSDSVMGAVQYASAQSAKQGSEHAPVIYRSAQSVEDEATQVVQEVTRVIKAQPEASVAILVRSRTHLNAVLPALRQAGIAYHGLDLQSLAQAPAVLDVVSLARALSNPSDRVAWLSLLRGPWLGWSLATVHSVCADAAQPVIDALRALDPQALSQSEQPRFVEFLAVIESALAQQSQVGLARLTQWAWQRLGGEHTRFGLSLKSLQLVFDLLSEHQVGGVFDSLSQFERALAAHRAVVDNSAEQPKVVVTTIHNAKGLEFDTVILLGLARPAPSDAKSLLLWSERQSPTSGQAELLLAPYSRLVSNPHYEYLRHLERQKAHHENTRLMYVAATRAIQQLILVASLQLNREHDAWRAPPKASLLSTLWDTHHESFEVLSNDEAAASIDVTPVEPRTLYRLPDAFSVSSSPNVEWQPNGLKLVRPHDPQAPNEESEALEFAWAGEVARQVGQLLHDWMQELTMDDLTQLPTSLTAEHPLAIHWQRQLHALGLDAQRRQFAMQRLEKAVTNLGADSNAHFIFQSRESTQTELGVSSVIEGAVRQFRFDRSFVDEGERWIIDFKTTDSRVTDNAAFARQQVSERHRPQLERYGALMQEIDSRPIRLAVYFPLLQQLISWPFDS